MIHTRHLKKTFKGNQKDKRIISAIDTIYRLSENLILETPYNQNDDFYIIYLGLLYKSKILTNDNYRDHIFNFRANKIDSDENMVENYIDDLYMPVPKCSKCKRYHNPKYCYYIKDINQVLIY